MKKLSHAFVLIPLALYAFVYHWSRPNVALEPDQFLHLHVARQIAETGAIEKIPQVDNLGWSQRYPNLYPLFSYATGMLYRSGGESAVWRMVPVLGALTVVLLTLVAQSWLGPFFGALLATALLATPDFATRLVSLRPHVAAILFFVLLIHALLRERPWLAAASAALYALTYHALYLPGAALVCYAAARSVKVRPTFAAFPRRTFWAALGGLVAGLVINPGFPHNVLNILQGASVAAGSVPLDIQAMRPVELRPLPVTTLLTRYAFFLAVLVVGWRQWFAKRRDGNLLFLCVLATGFWGLTLVTWRIQEYAVPVSLFVAALALAPLLAERRARPWVLTASGALVLPMALFTYLQPIAAPARQADILESVAAVPQDARGKKIFNCEWYLSPFLLYRRPDVKFVDISDPAALALTAPGLSLLRDELLKGRLAYPYGVLRNAFRSDYALCDSPIVAAQLESDPHFRRLYPAQWVPLERHVVGVLYLYELAADPRAQQVVGYQATAPRRLSPAERDQLTPALASGWQDLPLNSQLPRAQRMPYANLLRWEREPLARGIALEETDLSCAWVRATAEEGAVLVGKSLLGVGGGPWLRLWLNNREVATLASGYDGARALHHLIALPRAIDAADTISALACAPAKSGFFGVGFSGWNPDEVEATCRWKGVEGDCLGPVVSYQQSTERTMRQ